MSIVLLQFAAMTNVMNLNIRVRAVHILFTEKELKLLLVSSGRNEYTLPIFPYTLLNINDQFIGQITKIPILQIQTNDKDLAIDFYILVKPALLSGTPKGAKWFSLEEAVQLNNSIAAIIDQTLKKLREDLNYQPIEYYLLPENFTLIDLQSLYELILSKKLNRGNFYRKMKSLDILERVGTQKTGNAYRSPILYTFNKNYFKKTEEGLFKEF